MATKTINAEMFAKMFLAGAKNLESKKEWINELNVFPVPDGDTGTNIIGTRHGEKLYETLLTNEECTSAVDMGEFYRVPADTRGLNYDKYFNDGNIDRNPLSEFNSNNTDLLNVEEVKQKLLSLEYIREELKKGQE